MAQTDALAGFNPLTGIRSFLTFDAENNPLGIFTVDGFNPLTGIRSFLTQNAKATQDAISAAQTVSIPSRGFVLF